MQKAPRYKQIKTRMLRAAEKRGVRVMNISSSPPNHTMSNFRSPHIAESLVQKPSTNILVSDNKEIKTNDLDVRYTTNNVPDFMKKYKYLQQSQETSKSYNPSGVYIKTSNPDSFSANEYQRLDQTSVHKKTITEDFGINQKVNLNININYSPTEAKFIQQKGADPSVEDLSQNYTDEAFDPRSKTNKILRNKQRVERAINSFIPQISFGANQNTKKLRRKDKLQKTLQTSFVPKDY